MEKDKLKVAMKAIANMADGVEDIPGIIMTLARIPDEQWEQAISAGIHHRKMLVTGVCVLCSTPFEAYSLRASYDELCLTCQEKHYYETARIATHRYRAKKAGLPSTLKMAEWLRTQKHFNMLCAYCQVRPVEALDHYMPITLGGGTVASNVVPSCETCNRKKMYVHPDKVRGIPRSDMLRVYEYLSSFQTGT